MRERLLVIGNFDGVHRGHRAVLEDASAEARERGLELVLLTFDPHPAVVLGRAAPPLLTRLARKIELVAEVTPDANVVVERFDHDYAALSPEEFARTVLAERHRCRAVIVGHNFRFGHGRAGDFDELARLGKKLGFETKSHALVSDGKGPWSSTRVREAIAIGDVADAERMLGRPHMLSGEVSHGDQRGRTIGFPTANIADIAEALPPNGVFAVRVDRAPGAPEIEARGVANLGVRPTVKEGETRRVLEVHLFDFEGDLYGTELRVHLVARLRAEKRFESFAALKEQIAKDAQEARAILER